MLVNELLIYVFDENDKIIEGLYEALKTYAVGQKNDYGYFVFPELVKKTVLKTLAFTAGHDPPLFPEIVPFRFFLFTLYDSPQYFKSFGREQSLSAVPEEIQEKARGSASASTALMS
jgi:hypothetical protein